MQSSIGAHTEATRQPRNSNTPPPRKYIRPSASQRHAKWADEACSHKSVFTSNHKAKKARHNEPLYATRFEVRRTGTLSEQTLKSLAARLRQFPPNPPHLGLPTLWLPFWIIRNQLTRPCVRPYSLLTNLRKNRQCLVQAEKARRQSTLLFTCATLSFNAFNDGLTIVLGSGLLILCPSSSAFSRGRIVIMHHQVIVAALLLHQLPGTAHL